MGSLFSRFRKDEVKKPGSREAESLLDKYENGDKKQFKNQLMLLFNQAYMTGIKEAMLDDVGKDKTEQMVILLVIMNFVLIGMFVHQFFM